jgi:uncharacterized membrane protein YphA (DoxX/SURF4 family)
MENLIRLGRLNYAIGVAGLGLQQFFFPGFRPVLIPGWPEWMPNPQPLIYLSSIGLIISGIFIVSGFRARHTSLILGSILLFLLIVAHIPFQIANNTTALGGWTDAFKILALSGGSFVIAGSFNFRSDDIKLFQSFEKLIPVGRIFFGVMMIVFGIRSFSLLPIRADPCPCVDTLPVVLDLLWGNCVNWGRPVICFGD